MKRNITARALQFLKEPSLWFCVLAWCLTAGFIAGAITAAVIGGFGPIEYVLYASAAVLLGYTVYTGIRFASDAKAAVVERVKRYRFTGNLIGDYGFRTIVFAVCSFAVNAAYVILNAVLAFLADSFWYASVAGYYLFLSGLRFGILSGGRKIRQKAGADAKKLYEGKLKLYRGCGIALLVLETALGGAVTQMVLSESPSVHTQIMAIGSAAYTFYKVTLAIYNLAKVKRYKDPLLQSFRNINLTDASVSLLALQTTLVSVFSEGADAEMKILNCVTGFFVCVLTIVLGIFMIVRANQKLKALKEVTVADGRAES